MLTKKRGYVEGSGNVYADLGVANPQEARAKADLAHRIVDIIASRKLTQVQAGKVLGRDQPQESCLLAGRRPRLSLERPFRSLPLLGRHVSLPGTARRP